MSGSTALLMRMDGSVGYVAAGIANDPWEKLPRLAVTHLNGQEVAFSLSKEGLSLIALSFTGGPQEKDTS